MGKLTPLFASETTAAALLDMKPREFRDLVKAGVLPGPTKLGRMVQHYRKGAWQKALSKRAQKLRE